MKRQLVQLYIITMHNNYFFAYVISFLNLSSEHAYPLHPYLPLLSPLRARHRALRLMFLPSLPLLCSQYCEELFCPKLYQNERGEA